MYLSGQRGSAEGRPTDHISSGAQRPHAPGKPVVSSHPLCQPLAANSGRFRRGEVFLRAVVKRTVVGRAGAPAAPDNPHPGSSKNPDCVLVILTAGTGASVDICGPEAFVPTVVGEGGDSEAQAFITCPSE